VARFRYGCGVHKVEWVLSEPVPWQVRECAVAGTVHVGGPMMEIAAALRSANADRVVQRPFVLFGQPTQCDVSRAPAGAHNAWAYCCVPAGSAADHGSSIEAQVERFAPGFRDVIVARHVRTAIALEAHNPNLVGGSLGGAVRSPLRFFLGPFRSLRSPYLTPLPGVYLCSAYTPPGPGVHGMCGFHAAHRVLRDLRVAGADLYPDPALSIL
jgi:phytoene dehydrogenase-like protein